MTLSGDEFSVAARTVLIALTATVAVLYAALRFGHGISRLLAGRTDESLLVGVMGTAVVARGEFSIVIAGLAVGQSVDVDPVPLAAAYVLLLAAVGPVLTRFADPLADRMAPLLPSR